MKLHEFQKTYLDKMRCKVVHIHTFSSLYTLLSTHTVHIYLFCLCCKLYGYFGLCFSPAAWVGSEAATWRQVSCQLFTITFPAGANVRTVTSPALIFVVFVHSDIVKSFLDTMHKTGGARPCFAFKFLLILLYLLNLGCDFTSGFLCLAEMKVAVHYIAL